MKNRWLAGAALFALGFACAHLTKVGTADAADTAGDAMLDEGLQIIEHDDTLELVDSGNHRYLLLVTRKLGADVPEPEIAYASGSAKVSKEALESLTVVRLVARAELSPTLDQRECRPDFEDCVEPDPLPFPRPPRPMIFLKP